MRLLTAFGAGLLALLGFSGLAVAGGEDAWVHYADTDDSRYSLKKGTLRAAHIGGAEHSVALVRMVNQASGEIQYAFFAVSKAHCLAGVGQLVGTSIDGEEWMSLDYVEQGGNVASLTGELLCMRWVSPKWAD